MSVGEGLSFKKSFNKYAHKQTKNEKRIKVLLDYFLPHELLAFNN
jgi:hypothetical protein